MRYPHEIALEQAKEAVREGRWLDAALLYFQSMQEGNQVANQVFFIGNSGAHAINNHPNEIKNDDDQNEIKPSDMTVGEAFVTALRSLMGLGVNRDDERAFKLLDQWATNNEQRGEPESKDIVNTAMYTLGVLYANGHGVEQSYPKAIECYQKAADRGDTSAMLSLEALYANGHSNGGKCLRNQLRALYWFKQYNQHQSDPRQQIDLPQESTRLMFENPRALAFALALITEDLSNHCLTFALGFITQDLNPPPLETAITSLLSDEHETAENKEATISQLCEEIINGKFSLANANIQETLVTLWNPADDNNLFHTALNDKQRIDLLIALILRRHQQHIFLQPNDPDAKPEISSPAISDKTLLEALADLTPTIEFLQVDKPRYNQLMSIMLSFLKFPENDEDSWDNYRYQLFRPFIMDLALLQRQLDEGNKSLFASKIWAYLSNSEEQTVNNAINAEINTSINTFFQTVEFSNFHCQALGKAYFAQYPSLDEKDKGPRDNNLLFCSLIREMKKEKTAALQQWKDELIKLHQIICEKSYWVTFPYTPIGSPKMPTGIAAIDQCLNIMIESAYSYNPHQKNYDLPLAVQQAFKTIQSIAKDHLKDRETADVSFFKSTNAIIIYHLASQMALPPSVFGQMVVLNEEPAQEDDKADDNTTPLFNSAINN